MRLQDTETSFSAKIIALASRFFAGRFGFSNQTGKNIDPAYSFPRDWRGTSQLMSSLKPLELQRYIWYGGIRGGTLIGPPFMPRGIKNLSDFLPV